MIVRWIQGCPWGVRPIDRFLVKSLGSDRVHKELPARFESSHCNGKERMS